MIRNETFGLTLEEAARRWLASLPLEYQDAGKVAVRVAFSYRNTYKRLARYHVSVDADDLFQELCLVVRAAIRLYETDTSKSLLDLARMKIMSRLHQLSPIRTQKRYELGEVLFSELFPSSTTDGDEYDDPLSYLIVTDQVMAEVEERMQSDAYRRRFCALFSERDMMVIDHLMNGLDQKRIAQILGCSQPAVSSRVKKIAEKFTLFRQEGEMYAG